MANISFSWLWCHFFFRSIFFINIWLKYFRAQNMYYRFDQLSNKLKKLFMNFLFKKKNFWKILAVVLQFYSNIANAYNISVQSFIDNSCYRFWSIIFLHKKNIQKKELRVGLLYLNRDYCSIYVVFLFQKCFFKSTFDDDIYKNNNGGMGCTRNTISGISNQP